MTFTIPAEGPLDAASTLARYHLWGDDPATRIGANSLSRVLRADDRLYAYEVTWRGGRDDTELTVTVPGTNDAAVLAAVRREVEQVFGLGADLSGFYRMAKGDPGLRGFVEPLYGLRPSLAPTPLEMLVGSICAQQVNLAFAFATRARLVRRYGTPVRLPGRVLYAFPAAPALARARVSTLRRMQFSGRKAEYIVGVARAVVDGRIDLAGLAACDNDEVIARLTALRGLGRWSAEWFLARCLGRGDVCPAGDLAVRKAFAAAYNRGRPLSDAAIRRRARRWGVYQNLAVHYLLAGLRRRRAVGGGA
jgi:DNA-3-methyladenine glycosylase II